MASFPSAQSCAVKITAGLGNQRRQLSSTLFEVPEHGILDRDVSLSFSFQYIHHHKKSSDILHIHLQQRIKGPRRFKTRAVVAFDLGLVLQFPVNDVVILHSKSNPLTAFARLHLTAESLPVDAWKAQHGDTVFVNRQREKRNRFEEEEESESDDTTQSSETSSEDDVEVHGIEIEESVADKKGIGQRIKTSLTKGLKIFPFAGKSKTSGGGGAGGVGASSLSAERSATTSDSDSAPTPPLPPPPPTTPVSPSRNQLSISGLPPAHSRSRSDPTTSDFSIDSGAARLPLRSSGTPSLTLSIPKTPPAPPGSPPPPPPEKSVSTTPRFEPLTLGKGSVLSPAPVFSEGEDSSGDEFNYVDVRLSDSIIIVPPHRQGDEQPAGTAILSEQLSRLLKEDQPPSFVILVSTLTRRGKKLGELLRRKDGPLRRITIFTQGSADVHTVLTALFSASSRVNPSQSSDRPTKILLAGTDSYINDALRSYVQLMSERNKASDALLFSVLPIAKERKSEIFQYLCTLDSTYSSLFNTSDWRDIFERKAGSAAAEGGTGGSGSAAEAEFVERKVGVLLHEASRVVRLGISEVFITFASKKDVPQTSVPFIKAVRVNVPETEPTTKPNREEAEIPSGSGPTAATGAGAVAPTTSSSAAAVCNGIELKVDYWQMKQPADLQKISIRGQFQALSVYRMPSKYHTSSAPLQKSISTTTGSSGGVGAAGIIVNSAPISAAPVSPAPTTISPMISAAAPLCGLTFVASVRKDKKDIGTVLRTLGASSQSGPKPAPQLSEIVQRLICATSGLTRGFSVDIDDVEWTGVQFMSISPQWSSHVKTFPVVIFGTQSPGPSSGSPF